MHLLRSGDPEKTWRLPPSSARPCFSFRNMHISSLLKVHFPGLQPVATGNSQSPPALVNRSVKSRGKLDNLSASQSDMAESFFNKGIIASGLANTNVIIKIVLVI